MKLVLVVDWPREEGGIETHALHTIELLAARGHECVLLTGSAGRGASIADSAARSFEWLPAKAVAQLWNPLAWAAARNLTRSVRPDAAIVFSFERDLSAAALAGLGQTPYVAFVGYYKPICPTGLKLLPSGALCTEQPWRPCRAHRCLPAADLARQRLRYAGLQRALRGAAAVVACSEWLCRELETAGVPAASMPWPVRPRVPTWRHRPAAAPTFLYCGRLTREKGCDGLLRALASVRRRGVDVRLRIAGDGPARPDLLTLSRSLGLDGIVDWLGWVPHESVPELLAESWALVAPSLWAEPLGLGVVEAIVHGVPVVASSAGGHSETIEHGSTGLLFANGDEEALAGHLEDVATGTRFPTLRVPSEVVAARHDPATFATQLLGLIERVTAERARPPASRPAASP